MDKIGFIGLGKMGLPMASNLIKKGYAVTGFDLHEPALAAFAEQGGTVVRRLAEMPAKNYVITMLQTGQQVMDVCTGLYALMPHGMMHIDCSTIDVETTRRLHQLADEKNILSLDAPVSGGVAAAKAGTLTFMVGGRSYDFQKASPLLSCMGTHLIHAGGAGSGQVAKICNNMILGSSMIAAAEAFSLAEALGLSAHKLHEVVTQASGQSWVMSTYVPVPDLLPDVPANRDYQPGFPVAMMLKDLLLSQQAATQAGVFSPIAERATQLYELFSEEGFGDLDFSAIIKAIKK